MHKAADAAPAAPAELKNITVEEVSIVDHPANQRRFLIVKSEDNKGPGADQNATQEKAPMSETQAKKQETATTEAPKEPAAPPAEKTEDVEASKAGRKISRKRLERMRGLHSELSSLLGELDDAAETDAEEPAAKAETKTETKTEPSPAVDVAKLVADAVTAAMAPLAESFSKSLETVGAIVKSQGDAISELRKSQTIGGNSRRAENEDPVQKSAPTPWPLDMNRPLSNE